MLGADGVGPNPDTIGALLLAAGYSADTPVGIAEGVDIGTDALIGVESVVGGAGNDSITGNGFANIITGAGGNDTIVGGGGNDTAVFSGLHSQYQITRNLDGSFQVLDQRGGSPDGTDQIRGVERFQFADRTITAEGNDAPVLTVPNIAATPGKVINGLSLFTASDADGDALTYYFYDNTAAATSGHFTFNGVDVAPNTVFGVSAAQLDLVSFTAGRTSDQLLMNIFDGLDFSQVKAFNVNVPANHAPVLTVPNVSALAGQVIDGLSLFTASDADGDALTYYFYDNTAAPTSGHFTFNGVDVAANTVFGVSAAQLDLVTFTAGSDLRSAADEHFRRPRLQPGQGVQRQRSRQSRAGADGAQRLGVGGTGHRWIVAVHGERRRRRRAHLLLL